MTSLLSKEKPRGYGSVPTVESDDGPIPSSIPVPTKTVAWKKVFEILVLGWFTPVLEHMREQIALGVSPNLEDKSVPPLRPEDSSTVLLSQYKRIRKDEQGKQTYPSLTRCLWKVLSPLFLQAGILKAVHDGLQFVGPQVLHGLIEFVRTPTENLSTGFLLTAVVTIAQIGMSLCLRHYFFMCYRVSLRVRTIVLLAIYEKALTIDPSYYQTHPVGQVTNLMSVDTQRLQDVTSYLHAVWYSVFQITLSIYFLWRQLGPSCLAGVLVIMMSIPTTSKVAKWMGTLQRKLMARKDERVQTNQECISSMKVIKLQAWEEPFREKVIGLRRQELRQLFFNFLGKAANRILWTSVPMMVALATFGAYVTIAGQVLDVATALTALSLFDILRFPLYMVSVEAAFGLLGYCNGPLLSLGRLQLPQVINQLIEANVAMKRIEEFLNAPDRPNVEILEHPEKRIEIKNGAFTYQNINHESSTENPSVERLLTQAEKELALMKAMLADAEDKLARLENLPLQMRQSHSTGSLESGDDDSPLKMLSLRQLNFECSEGEFIVVVGRVGAGKSTFLRSILGEVGKVKGTVRLRGKVAYFDQKPFIMNDTIRGNILFGKPDDNESLYNTAIKSSCLEHDLRLFPNGDKCEIGVRLFHLRSYS